MAKRLQKLTYSLKRKLSAIGKNPDDYRIKEKRFDGVIVVNIKTNDEITLH